MRDVMKYLAAFAVTFACVGLAFGDGTAEPEGKANSATPAAPAQPSADANDEAVPDAEPTASGGIAAPQDLLDCFCFILFPGQPGRCLRDEACDNVKRCPNGECPPGFRCAVGTCCFNGEAICLPDDCPQDPRCKEGGKCGEIEQCEDQPQEKFCQYKVKKAKADPGPCGEICGRCPYQKNQLLCSEIRCSDGQRCPKKFKGIVACPGSPGGCLVIAKLVGCVECDTDCPGPH